VLSTRVNFPLKRTPRLNFCKYSAIIVLILILNALSHFRLSFTASTQNNSIQLNFFSSIKSVTILRFVMDKELTVIHCIRHYRSVFSFRIGKNYVKSFLHILSVVERK